MWGPCNASFREWEIGKDINTIYLPCEVTEIASFNRIDGDMLWSITNSQSMKVIDSE